MILVEYHTEPTRGNPNLPFPRDIASDPWVLYHGTCNVNEGLIDRQGLQPDKSLFKRDEIQAVVDVFEQLCWPGLGAFAVLKPYSLEHGFSQTRGKPIYLAASAFRAHRYAGKDIAGGEVATALRCSFQDLDAYLEQPDVQEEHLEYLKHERRVHESKGAPVPPTPTLTLDELPARVNVLSDVRRRAESPAHDYRHGVVYAVKLSSAHTSGLEAHKSMGIMAFEPLPPNTLVAKAVIPSSYVHPAQDGSDAMGPAR